MKLRNFLIPESPRARIGRSVRDGIGLACSRALRSFIATLLLAGLSLDAPAQPALITGEYVYQQLMSFEASTLENLSGVSHPAALAASDAQLHGIAKGGSGGVFSLPRTGAAANGDRFELRHRFGGDVVVGHLFGNPVMGLDGRSPAAMVVVGDYVYGVTSDGGIYGNGVLFRQSLKNAGYAVLRHFAYDESIPVWKAVWSDAEHKYVWILNPDYNPAARATTDGAFPTSLILGEDGKLYGVTQAGGKEAKHQAAIVPGATAGAGWGTLFRFDPQTEAFETLYAFRGADSPNVFSPKQIVQGKNGKLHGITSGSGGVIFSISMDGSSCQNLKTLGAQANPSSLILAKDGFLYGTTLGVVGSISQQGGVFRQNPDLPSGFTVFTYIAGSYPLFNPVQIVESKSGGFLVSASPQGGILARLTIPDPVFSPFRASVQLVHNFNNRFSVVFGGETREFIDGAGVVQFQETADGSIFGVTSAGGVAGGGTVFSLTRPQPSSFAAPVRQPLPNPYTPVTNKVAKLTGDLATEWGPPIGINWIGFSAYGNSEFGGFESFWPLPNSGSLSYPSYDKQEFTYTPAVNYVGQDRFYFTIQDGYSHVAATVTADVKPPVVQSQNTASIKKVGSCFEYKFGGVPFTKYVVYYTPTLSSRPVQISGPVTTDRFGRATYLDCTPRQSTGFYSNQRVN